MGKNNKQIDEEGERRINMENFTKGPWRIEEFRDFTSIMAGYTEICYIDNDLSRYANARLIAAAPEMYELLKLLDNYLAIKGGFNDRMTTKISKLLKKVRGENE